MKKTLLITTIMLGGFTAFGQWSAGSNPTLPTGQTVGVGTSSPLGTMHLYNTGGSLLNFQRSGVWSPTVISATISGTGGSGGLRWMYSTDYGSTSSDLIFFGNNGFIGINNPTPLVELDIDGKLRIRDIPTQTQTMILGVDSDGDVFQMSSSSLGSSDADWFKVGTSTAPTSISDNIRTDGLVGIAMDPISSFGGVTNIKLSVSGNVYASGGTYTGSDARFKRNILGIDNAMNIINNLEGVTYEFNNESFESYNFPSGTVSGLIAQNVNDVFPYAVEQMGDGYYAVNYDMLIPVLIEAMKEQDQTIRDMQDYIYELKSNSSLNSADPLLKQKSRLEQNTPNPFGESTLIRSFINADVSSAELWITDLNGKMLRTIPVNERGDVEVTFDASDLAAGIYNYALVLDGELLDTRKMVLAK